MFKQISKFILKIFGWKAIVAYPEIKKSVICVAPHTSNWDFLLGKLCYSSVGLTAHFLIKKEWFFFPMGVFFRSIGGIPVERNKKTRLVDQVVKMFNENNRFNIAITPEGTRKRTTKWKMGFYHIALKAEVPIQLAYIDYKTKILSIEKLFTPTGNESEDMAIINEYYSTRTGRHPENFALCDLKK